MASWKEIGRQIRDSLAGRCEQMEWLADVKDEEKFIRYTERFASEVQALDKPMLENCMVNDPTFILNNPTFQPVIAALWGSS